MQTGEQKSFKSGTLKKGYTTISEENSRACIILKDIENQKVLKWSSKKERKGNALASGADEGRDKLR